MVSMFPSSVVFFSMRSTNSSAKILVFHRTRKRASRRVNGKHFQGVPMLGQPRRRRTGSGEGLRCGEGPERNRGATGRETAWGAGSAEFCCSVAVKTGVVGKGSWEGCKRTMQQPGVRWSELFITQGLVSVGNGGFALLGRSKETRGEKRASFSTWRQYSRERGNMQGF